MPLTGRLLNLSTSPVFFFLLACAFRSRVRHMESRFQIVLFVVLALLLEAGTAAVCARPVSVWRPVQAAAAAAVAIVTAKWWLEGLPPSLHLLLGRGP